MTYLIYGVIKEMAAAMMQPFTFRKAELQVYKVS